MHNLNLISAKQRTILLAEIAGLLHNLGKLDPNFLVSMMEDADDARRSVIKNLADIPFYDFQRLAAPDPNLLAEEWQMLLDPDAPNLESNLEDAVEDKPGSKKRLDAAKTLRAFLRTNGPLYRCFSKERPKRIQDWQHALEQVQTTRQELSQAEEEVARLARDLAELPPEEDRSQLGKEFNEAKNKKRELKRSLKASESRLEQLEQHGPLEEQEAQIQLEARFREVTLGERLEPWPLADLLTLFWDDFFYREEVEDEDEEVETSDNSEVNTSTLERPVEDTAKDENKDTDHLRKSALRPWLKATQGTKLPALLILSHGYVSGSEKYWSSGTPIDTEKPTWKALRAATAFGYDRQKLDIWTFQDHRFHLIQEALTACAHPAKQRADFVDKAKEILQLGLGDTQWPINEIDLWDYASSIAALFKSGVARAVLDGTIPTVDAMRWRFLSVRFDGLGYLSQAHHVTDLLGRRDSLDVALDAVQTLLEETYPLGNEVYRDENGAVFVVPAWEENARSTLALANESGTTLKALMAQTFREATRAKSDKQTSLPAFDGELEPSVAEGKSRRGKKLQLGEYLQKQDQALHLTADPARMAAWWQDEQAQDQEICTVCGLRPVGYRPRGVAFPGWVKTKNAQERHLCCVCLHRRGRRAEEWLTQKEDTTIWADEVVDENGRFVLLVGQFDLQQWLDGTLIPSMQKPASFARVQRVWGTTQAFWEDLDKDMSKLNERFRLEITPQQLEVHDEKQSLGKYHTYELEIEGRRVGVVWDPLAERLLTTEYLLDLARRWDIPVKDKKKIVPILQTWLTERANHPWSLYEPSAYNEPRGEPKATFVFGGADGNDKPYVPYIPLLTEPARFMALIPADKAMDIVAAIREKYERKMSKVQDRLPLHLSVVIAKRRTPLRAVLDAGRALLERPSAWQEWTVQAVSKGKDAPEYLTNDAHFAKWWQVTLENGGRQLTLRVADRMGDGKTEDRWHAHFCTKKPGDNEVDPESDVTHVSDLTADAKVYLKPATFDFEYLDTTARRFAIAYDDTGGRRLGRASRPYLLNNVETLAKIWRVLNKHLASSQILWIHGLIEEKRRAWHLVARSGDRPQQEPPRGSEAEYTTAFERFVADTLRRAEWKDNKAPEENDFDLLKTAAVHGVLADVIDLYHEALKLEWKPQT